MAILRDEKSMGLLKSQFARVHKRGLMSQGAIFLSTWEVQLSGACRWYNRPRSWVTGYLFCNADNYPSLFVHSFQNSSPLAVSLHGGHVLWGYTGPYRECSHCRRIFVSSLTYAKCRIVDRPYTAPVCENDSSTSSNSRSVAYRMSRRQGQHV